MQGVVFTGVTGGNLDLNKDFTFANLTKSDDSAMADTICVWDPDTSAYTTYYFYNAEGDEENWGWHDENWDLDNAELPCGTAFWFKAKSAENKSMTQSGAIESADDVSFDIVSGKFNMLINPYPTDVDLNNASTVVITNYTPSDDSATADTVCVWDPSTSAYTTYYYYNAEGDEENWGWHDENWDLDDAIIPAGTGFWYKAKAGADKKVTFKTPVSK